MAETISARIPQLMPPGPNAREHWAKKAARVKRERRATRLVMSQFTPPALPVVVTLTRCGRRKMDPDNLVACMKAVIDSVAEWLGVDDGDESRVRFIVEQMTVPRPSVGVLVNVWRREDERMGRKVAK